MNSPDAVQSKEKADHTYEYMRPLYEKYVQHEEDTERQRQIDCAIAAGDDPRRRELAPLLREYLPRTFSSSRGGRR